MLRARLRWQSESQERLLDFSRRLAFCTATKILLAFISRAAGSTDTTSRKPGNEEKMFWKVTLPSALIFFCKRYFRIKVTFFTLICIFNRVRSVSCQDGGSRDWSWHSEIERIFYFGSLDAWWSFKQAKLTVGGEARAQSNPGNRVCVCFFSFFLSFLFLFLPTFNIFSPLPLPLLS